MYSIKKRNVIGAFFFMAMGLAFALGSMKYGSLRSGIPNAGFFPLLGGIILIVLSLMLLIPVLKNKEYQRNENFFPQKDSWKRLLIVTAILFFYGVVLEHVGFLMTTFVFMIAILRFIESPGWMTILFTSFATTGTCYLIFKVLLKIPLP